MSLKIVLNQPPILHTMTVLLELSPRDHGSNTSCYKRKHRLTGPSQLVPTGFSTLFHYITILRGISNPKYTDRLCHKLIRTFKMLEAVNLTECNNDLWLGKELKKGILEKCFNFHWKM